MKILYASSLGAGSSARTRLRALERLGHTVVPVDTDTYYPKNPLIHKITFRLGAGPGVNRLNADMKALALDCRPDLVWADKVLWLQPETISYFTAMGIFTLSYMIDNAFGPRGDPGFRLYKKTIPYFDLHVTQRDVSVSDLLSRGARNVVKVQTAYDQEAHYPPPEGWSDKDRTRDVSFIGSPYDERAKFLSTLSAAAVPLTISGSPRAWRRSHSKDDFARMFREGELWDDAYREGIWRSKINLSFITSSNQDEFTHKSFEIAGCGGFLLAERSEGHVQRFREGQEAVFFSGAEECIEKIRRYLPDEDARAKIALAGHLRAQRNGYHNDHQLSIILDRIRELREARAQTCS